MKGMAHVFLTMLAVALLFLLISSIPSSTAQEEDLEVITWAIDDSPIVLDESMEVPINTLLKVEAGVEVRLGLNVTILVRGELKVLGTEGAPVRFVRRFA